MACSVVFRIGTFIKHNGKLSDVSLEEEIKFSCSNESACEVCGINSIPECMVSGNESSGGRVCFLYLYVSSIIQVFFH